MVTVCTGSSLEVRPRAPIRKWPAGSSRNNISNRSSASSVSRNSSGSASGFVVTFPIPVVRLVLKRCPNGRVLCWFWHTPQQISTPVEGLSRFCPVSLQALGPITQADFMDKTPAQEHASSGDDCHCRSPACQGTDRHGNPDSCCGCRASSCCDSPRDSSWQNCSRSRRGSRDWRSSMSPALRMH